MTLLSLNLTQAPQLARSWPDAPVFPPGLREFLREVAQVLNGGLVQITPALDLDPALRRDLGLN